MKPENISLEADPQEALDAGRHAMVSALMDRAIADGEFFAAMIVATANMVGIREITNAVPIDNVIELMRGLATEVATTARPQVLQ